MGFRARPVADRMKLQILSCDTTRRSSDRMLAEDALAY